MSKSSVIVPVLLSFVAAHPAFAVAETTTAKSVVQTIIEKAKTLDVKNTKMQNEKTIEGLVDFQKLANDALGNRLKEASPAQRAEIRELLRNIITRTVYPEAPRFFRDVQVDYTNQETSDGRTHITSVVTKGDKRSTVEYWLADEHGAFRVVDLAIEGERWVENVHNQFDEIIGKHGVAGLIAKMKKRLTQLEKHA